MYFKYLKYVLKHKWYVFIECCKFGIPLRGILHDLSKFLPSEFIPYARYFYGNYPAWNKVEYEPCYPYKYTKEGVNDAFDYAWLLHQKRNPHHWQYWILKCDNDGTKILGMPLKVRKEMLADWIGAGIAITGKREVKEWYAKNRDNIILHPSTRVWIDCEVDKCK